MSHWSTASRLLSYAKSYRNYLILGMLTSVAGSILEAWMARLVQPFIDQIVIGHLRSWWVAYIPLFIILVALIRGLTRFCSAYYLSLSSCGILADMRLQLFDKMMALPVAFHDTHPSSQLVVYHMLYVNRLSKIVADHIVTFVRDFTMTIALTAVMVMISWQLSTMFFLITPLVAWCVRLFGKRIRTQQYDLQGNSKRLSEFIQERLRMQRIIKLHGSHQVLAKEYFNIVDYIRITQIKQVKSQSGNSAMGQWIMSFPIAFAVGLLIYFPSLITIGSFTALLLAMIRLRAPVSSLISTTGAIHEALALSKDLFKMLDEPEEADLGQVCMDTCQGEISYEGIGFTYANAKEAVFEGLSFSVQAGEAVAFVGASGSGKSTLMHLLARFYEPTSGQIKIDGQPIQDLTLASLRRQLAIVSQDVLLLNDTVENNLRLGSDAPFSAIKEACIMAQADTFIEGLSDGYQTVLGEDGVVLSGGQRQRLALARSLLQDAPIIIFDEATSSLDAVSEAAIQEVIFSLVPKKTLLIISHRLSSIQRANRLIVMDKGRIVGQGSHNELMANNAHYQALYYAQHYDQTS